MTVCLIFAVQIQSSNNAGTFDQGEQNQQRINDVLSLPIPRIQIQLLSVKLNYMYPGYC